MKIKAGLVFAGCLVASIVLCRGHSDVDTFIKKTVHDNSLVIFSKSYCPYCRRAKAVFKDLGATPYVLELDMRADGAAIQQQLGQTYGVWTVPQVFIGGKRIGGSDDVVEARQTGQLQKLLSNLKQAAETEDAGDL